MESNSPTTTIAATQESATATLSHTPSNHVGESAAFSPESLVPRASATQSVCVVGMGYIGLPTASLLAANGHRVHGVDLSTHVVDTINRGEIHIQEPDLDVLVHSVVSSGRLSAGLEPIASDVFIIAVPTPLAAGNQPDITAVQSAARAIAPVIKAGDLIILESTSPVGTTHEAVAEIIAEAGFKVGEEVFLAYCPERVLPGQILRELIDNDRVVGGVNPASTDVARAFYEGFVKGNVLATDSRTAEMVKLTENAFRDVNLAFANELSMLCATEGVSVWDLISLANRHPRVNILSPGAGVGGHCIPIDPWFLAARNPEEARLISTARQVNDRKPEWVMERVKKSAARFKDPVIACLGLTFKADVDDLRTSPALDIAKRLDRDGIGEILVVEPNLDSHADFELHDLDSALERADIVLVLVDHTPFRHMRPDALHEKLLIDTRGILR